MKEYKTKEQKRKFYDSKAWKKLRYCSMKLCNYECQRCKRNGEISVDDYEHNGKRKKIKLVVHHKKEIENYPELAHDIDNLEVLCVKCHNIIHGRTFEAFEKKPNEWEHDEKW